MYVISVSKIPAHPVGLDVEVLYAPDLNYFTNSHTIP